MKIVGIGGSLRPHSITYMALDAASAQAKKLGAEVEIVDLRSLNLPFCIGGSDYADYPDVHRLRALVKSADGLILATPEYHGTISGVLKNALDLLRFEDMDGKVCALIGVLGGELSHNMMSTMRLICRQLHAWVVHRELIIPFAEEAFDKSGQLIQPKSKERMSELMESLVEGIQQFGKK